MATTIQIKRSSTASGVPLATDLAVGELAVNLADKRLFTKQSDGTIIELSTNPTDLDAATLRIDGVEITASATELNKLDGFTGSTAELNLLDGLTATTIELNTLDGITASTAELNKLDGYTGSTAELNILDGVTATTAEINTLDGITATTTELNYTDGVTSNIQTQLDSKASATASPTITLGGDLSGSATLTNLGNATLTATVADDSHNHTIANVDGLQTALDGKATTAQGALADSAVQPDDNVSFGTGSFSGAVDVSGTVTADGLTVDTGGTAVILNHSATGPTLRFNNLDQTVADGQQLARIEFSTDDGGSTTDEAYLQLTATGGGGAADFDIMTGDGTPVRRARFGVGGDVSFYEDTGTTAKFHWDSSAERLQIGSGLATDTTLLLNGGDYDPTVQGGKNGKGLSIRGGTVGLGNRTGAVTFSMNDGGANAGSAAICGVSEHATSDDVLGLAFFTHASTTSSAAASEAMRIDSSGNVGIGTASPSEKLEVAGGNIELDSGYSLFLGSDSNVSINSTSSTRAMRFQTADTERARIDSSGNLLVGTTTKISDGISIGAGRNFSIVSDSTTSYLNMFRQAGSGSSILANGYKYSVTSNRMASSLSGAWAKSAIAAAYGSVIFYTDSVSTDAVGADITPTERARIDANGNLLVGTTSSSSKWVAGNGVDRGFEARGAGLIVSHTSYENQLLNTDNITAHIRFYYRGSATGSINTSGSGTVYATTSDYRLKENVVALDSASDRVKALKPCRFNFITDPDNTVDGFLAHEAQEVVPEAVTGAKDAMKTEEYEVTPAVEATYDEDGNELTPAVEAVMGTREVPDYQGIDQSKLVPLLTKALQEALDKIEQLEQRVDAMENN